MISLKGKVAIVTGAAQGIGLAISQELSRLGAFVALVDRDESGLSQAENQLVSDGGKAQSFAGDVTDSSFLDEMVKTLVADHGHVDVLVNNAGIIRDNFLTKLSEEDWDQVMAVNLKGPFLCCRSVIPRMREQKSGKIVNIISRSWLGNVGQSNYSASKGAW